MTDQDPQTHHRFPWGYFSAALMPLALIGAVFAIPALLSPQDAMAPAMLAAMLIGPAGALVAAWGIIRVGRGEGRDFPALWWLIWLPVLIGLAGIALS